MPQQRVKTPTVLQMEAVECGAAALGIVLGYHGRIVPLEKLRLECGVSRDGANAKNMLHVARSYGLTAKGYRKEPPDLPQLPLPLIVFWNFNHFVVVEGFSPQRVYLNDPATGPRTVTPAEFDQSFTGVVLTFEPGPTFEPGGQKPSLIQALKDRLLGSESALAYIIIAGLALVIPGLIIPAFIRIFVDDILIKEMTHWLGPLLIGMTITLFLNGFLTWLRELYLLRLETKLALTTSGKYFWHVLRLPIEFFTQRYAGDIGDRVAINDRVARLLSGDIATTFVSLITVMFFIGLMVQYSVRLTGMTILLALLNLVALRLVSRRRVDISRKLVQERGKLVGVAMSGLQNIETLKATATESDFFSRWAGYQAKVVNIQQSLAAYNYLLAVIPPALLSLNLTLILVIGGLQVIEGQMTMGLLIAFQGLMLNFMTPFNRLVNLGSLLQEVEGDMNRLDDVLRYQVDSAFQQEQATTFSPDGSESTDRVRQLLHQRTGATADTEAPTRSLTTEFANRLVYFSHSRKLAGKIELRQLTFGYNRLAEPLINDFNLTVEPGARVALVGGSGSGKSTIARLVAGLFEPWSGQILFDGWPRTEIRRRVLVSSIALVDQEIVLFAGPIKDNLTMWDTTIPEANIIRAAKDAAIHEVITARPGGYEGWVSEGARNFSGGQRQRLEIARALVNDPSILILDEATSALDPTTEKMIDDNLRRRGCTCLIVAHRLSTIRDCDEIIVLDQGKVIQRGTHHELSQQADGLYMTLIQADQPEADSSPGNILDQLV